MIILLFSFFLSFLITAFCWWVFERRSRSSDLVNIRRRLGLDRNTERLSESSAPALIRQAERNKASFLQNLGSFLRIREKLQSLIESAGIKSTPERIQNQCAIAALLAGGVIFIGVNQWKTAMAVPAALLGATLAGSIPLQRLRRTARKRLAKFESQFPAALEFIARSMRAGHAFSISLEMLHRECEQPLAGEFRRVFEEQNLGMPLDAALSRLAGRVHLIDVQFFVSSVILQRRTGGNLTELLDALADVIRERYKLKGKVKAISAHGRMTAKALSAIPIIVGAMMFFVNKEYTNFFFNTTTGLEMLGASAGLQILAYVVINKIVTIEI